MNHGEPTVSVIIPVYNVAQYLRQCLDSVTGQTLSDIEIICVNDGSTDGSPAILEEYRGKDGRITVISRENGGISAARNCGMEHARGKYIYFLDSDDWIDPEALETLARCAEENEAEVVHFATRPFYESEDLRREHNYDCYFGVRDLPGVYSGVEYVRAARERDGYTAVVWLALWRRAYLLENGFSFIESIIHEDEPFSFLADLYAKRIVVLPTVLHHYRIRASSTVTSSITHKNAIGCFRGAAALLERGLRTPCGTEEATELHHAFVRLTNEATDKYRWLPAEEREKVVFPNEMENELFRQIVDNAVYYSAYRTDHPVAFRIGQAVTWLPRKVMGGIRCLREHDLGYTLRRVLYHLGLWEDEEWHL